jgi:hypothetical protein
MKNIEQPLAAQITHCRKLGAAAPRARKNTYITAPAMKKRAPLEANGGMSATMYRKARYVELQMLYTSAKDKTTPRGKVDVPSEGAALETEVDRLVMVPTLLRGRLPR